MVRKVGVHEDHEVAPAQLDAVLVGAAQAQLAGALEDLDLGEDLLELQRHLVGAIRAAVLDDDDLKVEVAALLGAYCLAASSKSRKMMMGRFSLSL